MWVGLIQCRGPEQNKVEEGEFSFFLPDCLSWDIGLLGLGLTPLVALVLRALDVDCITLPASLGSLACRWQCEPVPYNQSVNQSVCVCACTCTCTRACCILFLWLPNESDPDSFRIWPLSASHHLSLHGPPSLTTT